jgi:putative nucleotidyltransferase with HDIG domain
VKGVLEIFNRSRLNPNREWIDFLATLGGQTSIAIENSRLFQDLQRSNFELAMAYDATIEGWSRALDLRDRETEGHTRRVTDLTLRLARKIGLSESRLVLIKRGALLHDIGKMGIPDDILHKPDELSEEEQQIMRQHPQLAYDMLEPIAYLRDALNIPYCHHEKWDGSGYPRGLSGTQIPLEARLFAIVDVWDAITTDRPYRRGWPVQKALEYMQEQSGKYFDPQLVEIFLQEIKTTGL